MTEINNSAALDSNGLRPSISDSIPPAASFIWTDLNPPLRSDCMSTHTIPFTLDAPQVSLAEIERRLRHLERRDWWLWVTAVVIMLLLCAAVFLLAVPLQLDEPQNPLFLRLGSTVKALTALVVLFSIFAVYQQFVIRRLRAQAAAQIAVMAAMEARAEVNEKLAIIDPLTGLFNRRYSDAQIQAEIARARRQKQPFTVLFLDLNDFKGINDWYGHAAGDQALRDFAARIRKEIRTSDVPVRYGGDEFVLLLPNCGAQCVPDLLARLKDPTVEYEGQMIPMSFSAGWAEWRPGDTADELVRRADQALYTEKGNGHTAKVTPSPLKAPVGVPVTPAEDPRATVLLVESSQTVRRLTREFLVGAGFVVLEAVDGPTALEAVLGYNSALDAAIIDTFLPGMSSRELGKRLAALRPQTRLVYLCGDSDLGESYPDVVAGTAAYVPKPFGPAEVVEKVMEVLAKKSQAASS